MLSVYLPDKNIIVHFPEGTDPKEMERLLYIHVYKRPVLSEEPQLSKWDKLKQEIHDLIFPPEKTVGPLTEEDKEAFKPADVKVKYPSKDEEKSEGEPQYNPFTKLAYEAAKDLNLGLASFSQHLGEVSKYIGDKLGLEPGGLFDKAAKIYLENAEYWRKKSEELGPDKVNELLGEAVGGAVPGVAEFMLNVPYHTLLGMAEAHKKGKSEILGGLRKGFERFFLGKVLESIGQLKPQYAIPATSATFAAQAASEGGSPEDVAKAAGIGAIYGAMPPYGEESLKDFLKSPQKKFESERNKILKKVQEAEQKPPEEKIKVAEEIKKDGDPVVREAAKDLLKKSWKEVLPEEKESKGKVPVYSGVVHDDILVSKKFANATTVKDLAKKLDWLPKKKAYRIAREILNKRNENTTIPAGFISPEGKLVEKPPEEKKQEFKPFVLHASPKLIEERPQIISDKDVNWLREHGVSEDFIESADRYLKNIERLKSKQSQLASSWETRGPLEEIHDDLNYAETLVKRAAEDFYKTHNVSPIGIESANDKRMAIYNKWLEAKRGQKEPDILIKEGEEEPVEVSKSIIATKKEGEEPVENFKSAIITEKSMGEPVENFKSDIIAEESKKEPVENIKSIIAAKESKEEPVVSVKEPTEEKIVEEQPQIIIDEKRARKFERLANNLQKKIDTVPKRDSQRFRTELKILNSLANAFREGYVPDTLANVKYKADVKTLALAKYLKEQYNVDDNTLLEKMGPQLNKLGIKDADTLNKTIADINRLINFPEKLKAIQRKNIPIKPTKRVKTPKQASAVITEKGAVVTDKTGKVIQAEEAEKIEDVVWDAFSSQEADTIYVKTDNKEELKKAKELAALGGIEVKNVPKEKSNPTEIKFPEGVTPIKDAEPLTSTDEGKDFISQFNEDGVLFLTDDLTPIGFKPGRDIENIENLAKEIGATNAIIKTSDNIAEENLDGFKHLHILDVIDENGSWLERRVRKISDKSEDKGLFQKLKELKLDLPRKDLSIIRQITDLPLWVAKSFPEFGRIQEIIEERFHHKNILRNSLLEDIMYTWNLLSKKERKKVSDLLWKEDEMGKTFPEEAKKLGENPYKFYLAVRDTLNYIWNYDLPTFLRDMGLPRSEIESYIEEAGVLEGYMPRIRKGRYYIRVIKDGETKWRQHFDDFLLTVTRKKFGGKAVILKKKLQKKFPGAVIEIGENLKWLPEEVFFETSPIATEELINKALEYADLPEGKEEFKRALSKAAADVFKQRGFMSHSMQRTGVPGYEKGDAIDALVQYINAYAGYKAKMFAAAKIREEWAKIDWSKRPNLRRYAEKQLRDTFANLDAMDRAVDKARAYFFFQFLSGVVKSAFIQPTQNFIAAWPRLSLETKWALPKLSLEMAKAVEDIIESLYKPKSRVEVQRERLTEEEARALARGRMDGTITDLFTQEVMGGYRDTIIPKSVSASLKWFFGSMEIFNRETTMLVAFRAMKEKGLKFEEAYRRARQLVVESHGEFGRQNLPPFARGSVGKFIRPAYAFRSYTQHMISFWRSLMTEHGIEGQKALFKSMVALLVLGGVKSIPLIETINDELRKHFGKDIYNEIIKHTGDTAKYIIYGLTSLLDIDLTGSLSIEAPRTVTELIGVPYSYFRRTELFLEDAKVEDWWRATEDFPFTPNFIRNPLIAYRYMTRGLERRSGKPIAFEGYKMAKLSPAQAALKALGFQPIESSEFYRVERTKSGIKQYWEGKRQDLIKKYAIARKAKGNKEKLRRALKEIAEFNKKKPAWVSPITAVTLRARILPDKYTVREVMLKKEFPTLVK